MPKAERLAFPQMRRTLLATVLVLVACSPGTEAADTTTSLNPTTSSDRNPTTIPAETTSTTAKSPTTTTLATTTTIEATTTTKVLDGNWADQPLIVTGFGALGWWDGSEWVRAEDEGALPVVGGEDYQIAVVGRQAKPPHRFSFILIDAATIQVHRREIGLRASMPLVGRQVIPPHRFSIILRDASAIPVH